MGEVGEAVQVGPPRVSAGNGRGGDWQDDQYPDSADFVQGNKVQYCTVQRGE